jgi:serine/threonine protein phosphatase 1
MNKIFAIGDIHGCLNPLRALIKSLTADRQNDTLLFIGDYIDRGSSSPEVVDYVIGLSEEFRKVVYLLGNHEKMLLRYLDGIEKEMYLFNGGAATLLAYGLPCTAAPPDVKAKIPVDHLHFFRSLLPYYETEDYIFVHAGLAPGLALSEQSVHDLLWVRQDFIDSDYDFGKRVIFGHTPLAQPLIMPNKIGIDTGAVYGGRLTCLELPVLKIHQV